jgi:PPK2 family polyphosphate:nucleotide phosphotransferase
MRQAPAAVERPGARWVVSPEDGFDPAGVDTSSVDGAPGGKDQTGEAASHLRHQLAELQERLWAERGRSLLVVLQALDGGGKDGTIRHVFRGVNPQGCRVTSFRAPTEEEQAHDFLWRVHRAVLAHGEIGIFNRSHYEDVLVARVKALVPERVWRQRYRTICDFERGLSEAGTRIVKLFLHISRDEQAERFRSRLERPDKRWKFRVGDLEDRRLWDDYQAAFRDAIAATTAAHAPWYVIPADRKWYRNWAVLTVLVETLRSMDPRFPAPQEDLAGVVVD